MRRWKYVFYIDASICIWPVNQITINISKYESVVK